MLMHPSASALPVKDPGTMKMKVTYIRKQDAAGKALSESVPEAVNPGEVVKDDRTADHGAFADHIKRGFGGAVVVGVDEAENYSLVDEATDGLNDIARNDLDVSAV